MLLFLLAVSGTIPAACGSRTGSASIIVYEAQTGDIANIHTIDPQTGATKQLTHGTSFDGNPAWSPDRKRIVFNSRRDGLVQPDLYVMDADGTNVQRLTNTPDAGEWSPKYSSDGRRLAYVRQDAEGWSVWVADSSGANARQVAGAYVFAEFPAWTPDQSELYFSAIMPAPAGAPQPQAHIYSVDVATNDVRTRIDTGGTDACPHFSHDGKTLTYAASRTGGEYDTASNLDLFAHDASSDDTTGVHDTALTEDPARDDYGNPSPDDKQIVFISDRDGNAELYMMDRDGSHQRRLTNTPDVRENVPDW